MAVEELTGLVTALFSAKGASHGEAQDVAASLVGANLTGHDSHGVVRVPRYLDWIDDGTLRPGRELDLVTDGGVFVLADGGHGFGQTLGRRIVDLGIDRASTHGVAITALRRSGHIGRIGEWAERAAAADLVSIHCVNVHGSVLVAPFGAREKRFSTAPFAVGVPQPDAPPLILDFATSLVAEGKVLNAFKGGKALPADCIIATDGQLTDDPCAFYGTTDRSVVPVTAKAPGALVAMGLHKGSGLAFMMELLGGALTGGGTCGPDKTPVANGMLSIYLDPHRLDPANDFHGEVARFVAWVRGAAPRPGIDEVLVPGDAERRLRLERTAEGVPLPVEVWRGLQNAAQRLGVR
ncbi:MAG: malate/lactate/ureidoglycolate dehydrogenase [Geminicoccaceae bacterium]|nr:MAG: malate/lactate/ureidoglycolate dehydrogenase [Geminicoccaceae bacterium]